MTGSAAAKELALHRRNVYESLERLKNKGLVSFVLINGKKNYSANTSAMLRVLEDKKKLLEEIIPELKKPQELMKVPEIQILTGKEGMKLLFHDEYREAKPIWVIASPKFEKKTWDYFDITPDKMMALGIKVRLIYPESARDLGKRAKKERGKAMDIKYIPERHSSDMGIEIYGDNVALELGEELILKIKSEQAAKRFRDYFGLLWQMGKK
jgi:sugar-specific transcriptional regulator TrmB